MPTGQIEYWRKLATHALDRAEEVRTLAEMMVDQQTKAMMMRIAADYQRLAKLAQEHVGEDFSRRAL